MLFNRPANGARQADQGHPGLRFEDPEMKLSNLTRLLATSVVLAGWPQYSPAYITNTPGTFALLCSIPPHISEARIEKVSQEKGVIIWRQVRDLTGQFAFDVIKPAFGKTH